jgi:hypothetical protein
MKRYNQIISFCDEITLSDAQKVFVVIMNTFQSLYEDRNLCMFVKPHLFVDGKGNYLEVSAIGEEELCDNFFKVIKSNLEKLFEPKCDFNAEKGFVNISQFNLGEIKEEKC